MIKDNCKILDCAAGTGIYAFHFAQDGMTPQFCEKVDKWSEEQFETWCNYHYSVCREKSTLGASNHVVIVGKKVIFTDILIF